MLVVRNLEKNGAKNTKITNVWGIFFLVFSVYIIKVFVFLKKKKGQRGCVVLQLPFLFLMSFASVSDVAFFKDCPVIPVTGIPVPEPAVHLEL